jgi:hypothetical protein
LLISNTCRLELENSFFLSLEDFNWGYVQLAIVTIIFGGLQIWWISKVFKNQRKPRSMDNREFRRKTDKILRNEQK